MERKEMTDTIEKLLAYNQWRRGDEELPQPDPAEIGRLIDFACDELRRLECERDEAREVLDEWKRKYYDVADAITRESFGVEDLCAQARAIRHERDKARAEIVRLEQLLSGK